MAWAWIHYFALQFNLQIIYLQELLALCGIAAVYSLDRLIDPDPRLAELEQNGLRRILSFAFVAAMLGAGICMFLMSFAPWQMVVCCCAMSIGNWLAKKVFMGKTLFVTCAWICSCALLPFAPYAWTMEIYQVLIPWALLFAVACILCDVKDINSDKAKDVRSMPVVMGIERSLRLISYLSLLVLPVILLTAQVELIILFVLLQLCLFFKSCLGDPLLAPICVDGCLFTSACVVFFV